MGGAALQAFLLGFPALFSIINPLTGAFIFFEVTEDRAERDRERLLNAPETREAQKQEQAAPVEGAEDIALFPLTIPFTTGPGTIAVSVALGAEHPLAFSGSLHFFVGLSAAAVGNAAVTLVAYRLGDRIAHMLGPTGTRTVTRLFAFLLLCIGVQILITGAEGVLGPLMAAGHPAAD